MKNIEKLIDELFEIVISNVASWAPDQQEKFENNAGYKNSVVNDTSYVIDGITDENRSEIIDAVILLLND